MNVLFIAIDTLRADRLGCYGYRRATTPFLDALAHGGAVFESHYAPGVPTQPAFTTIFTGTHPLTHGVVTHMGESTPSPDVEWLPATLRKNKICTVTVDNLADHRTWFWLGSEYYINPRIKGEFPSCEGFNERAIEWLTHLRREPFFMHVHYWDPHTPYLPPMPHLRRFYEGDPTTTNVGSLEKFHNNPQIERWPDSWLPQLLQSWRDAGGPASGGRIEDVDFIVAAYDAEVRHADDGIRQLVATLDELKLLDETLLCIFGDHGEELAGEHDIYFDHHGLYEANIHVPLVMHWPGRIGAGRRVGAMTQHPDLFATVMDAMELPVPDMVEGQSLLPLARGQTEDSHWNDVLLTCECTWQKKWALRSEGYKLIVSREEDYHGFPPIELYDLARDPGELQNIADEQPLLARHFLDRFNALLAEMMGQRSLAEDPIAANSITLGKDMWRRLGREYPPRMGED